MQTSRFEQALRTATRVAVMTGAGMSAESGVPTFRAKDGIWVKFNPAELANINAFMANPQRVWEWYEHRRTIVGEAKPNAGHLALASMERYVERIDIITQNVDGLHQRAGSTRVNELHGSLLKHRCLDCGADYELGDDEHGVPHCLLCGGLIRPGVVWFGEELPQDVWARSEDAAQNCDLFLTIGTSAVVYPAAQMPMIAKEHGAFVVEINPDGTDFTPFADLSIRGKAGEELPKLLKMFAERT